MVVGRFSLCLLIVRVKILMDNTLQPAGKLCRSGGRQTELEIPIIVLIVENQNHYL